MTALMYVNVALASINTVLALVVGAIFWKNHRQVRSPFTLGLVLFALFVLLNNAIVVYHFVTMMPMFKAVDEGLVLAESLLQTAALAALAWATLR